MGKLYETGVIKDSDGGVFYCPLYTKAHNGPTYEKNWNNGKASISYGMRDYKAGSRTSKMILSRKVNGSFKNVTMSVPITLLSDRCGNHQTSGLHADFAQNGTNGYNFLMTDGSVQHIPLPSFIRRFGFNVSPDTAYFGTGFYNNAEEIMGINP